MGSTSRFFPLVFFLFSCLFPLFPQNGAVNRSNVTSINDEISRLEKLAGSPAAQGGDRYDAFLKLARLYQLSGNAEAALKALDGALALSPGDGQVLLEQGRILISIGEYEKASAALLSLLSSGQDQALLVQGQYLTALLELLSTGSPQSLANLADQSDFSDYRGVIYFTLWKFTGLASWKTRLITEFPQSPEAKAANGTVNAPATPLWMFSPNRNTNTQAPPPALPPAQTPPMAAQPVPPKSNAAPAPILQSPGVQSPGPQTTVLQTGLFSKQENAAALAERLKKAGFESLIIKRQVNGNYFWAVCVPYTNDMNAVIKKLKNAGFESFPIKY